MEKTNENRTVVVTFVLTVLGLHAAMLAYGAWVHSPACNEVAHLPAGISHWQFGRFELYRVNPPLVRIVAALPVLAVGCKTDWDRYYDYPGARPEFGVGEAFIAANGMRAFWLFTLARWACIPFSLLGGYVCWRWAHCLYGTSAGLIALILWCFCPELLAHGSMITPDVAATSLGVTAGYVFWRWLTAPSWSRALATGIALGLAELTKSCSLILFALWPVLWFIWHIESFMPRCSRRLAFRHIAQMIMIFVLAVYVLNLGYGFEGTGKQLDSYLFVSRSLRNETDTGQAGNRFANSWCGHLPVPFPESYVRGVDEQKKDLEHYYWPSYLRGTVQDHGWWYFYLYGLVVKIPIGIWILAVLSLLLPTPTDRRWRDGMLLLAPALAHIALVSSQTAFSIHFRYVLPALPFLFIWICRAAQGVVSLGPIATGALTIAITWACASSLFVYPHSLSYFNEFAGGPRNGHFHMVYSAFDWGQDLLELKRWLDDHPEAERLHLAYFGYFDAKYAGVDSMPPPDTRAISRVDLQNSALRPGWYAISATLLRGIPLNPSRNDTYEYFQRLRPVATAGYSIYIYHVTSEDIRTIERALDSGVKGADGQVKSIERKATSSP